MRLLVVEDEKRLAISLKRGLEQDGFSVDLAFDGIDGKWMATENDYDAIILDIMLPGLNGYRICRELRDESNWTPILMLTAKSGDLDETEALDIGADDFLRKPFSHVVLVARLRALLRRGRPERPVIIEAGDLRLDPTKRRATRGGTAIELSAREFAVLEYLITHTDQVVSKRDILHHVWNHDVASDPNIVEVYIRHLRKKIDIPFDVESIQTVRGTGYRLTSRPT